MKANLKMSNKENKALDIFNSLHKELLNDHDNKYFG